MIKKITFIVIFLSISTSMLVAQSAKEIILTNSAADDRYASYSASGKQIIFESNRDGNWEIYIMDDDGKNQVRLTTSESDDRRPSWHPNGRKIIFESNETGKNELYELTIENKEIKKINSKGINGEPTFARYSPNGEKIAFSLKESDQKSNIAIIDKEGNLDFITTYNFRSYYPNWSSDGKLLLFFSRHQTNNEDDEIYKINVDGSDIERLTNWPKHNFCPSWSNDTKKIAYVTSMENIRPEIYVMDSNGENQVRITYNDDGDTLPNWSSDNKKLLITGYRNGNYEICELTIYSN